MSAVSQHVEVDVPAEQAYAWWRGLTNLPLIMPDMKSVVADDADPTLAHWTMKGPLGVPITWDTKLLEDVPGSRIAWTTVESSSNLVKFSGSVDFQGDGDRTRVELTLQYDLPGGAAGRALAALFASPEKKIGEAMAAFKLNVEAPVAG